MVDENFLLIIIGDGSITGYYYLEGSEFSDKEIIWLLVSGCKFTNIGT